MIKLPSLKLIIMNTLTLFTLLALIAGVVPTTPAKASSQGHVVPQLSVVDLGNYRGQYLNVIYAQAFKPFMSKDSRLLGVEKIARVESFKIKNDTLKIKSHSLPSDGSSAPYNRVIFVISPQKNFSWVNADGSTPEGVLKTKNQQISLVNSINRKTIEQFVEVHGEKQSLEVLLTH